MRLGHNIPSLNIYTGYKAALASQSKAMNNISSGVRVNNAADDPYGIAQNENFNLQIRGLQMSSQNAQDGISLLQTAEGGLSGINSMIDRIRELTVQAGNDTNSTQDRAAIQQEVNQLVDGIDKLSQSTNMNGISPLASSGKITTMIGANVGEDIDIPTYNLQAASLTDAAGNSLKNIDITTESGRTTALNVVDAAAKTVNIARSKYGAIENRMDSILSNSSDISVEVQNADSSVMDVDVASEMLDYSKNSVIVQAGIAMMAQTNKFPQDILNILSNVKSK